MPAYETVDALFDAMKNSDSGFKTLLDENFRDSKAMAATNRYGRSCLLYTCGNGWTTVERISLVLNKVVEVCDRDMIQNQLLATDKFGSNCIMLICSEPAHLSRSVEYIRLIVTKIVEYCGLEAVKTQLSAMTPSGENCFKITCRVESVPAMKLIASLLHHFDLFKRQYEALSDDNKQTLKDKAGIESSSWNPDPENIAEVAKMLQLDGRAKQSQFNAATTVPAINNNVTKSKATTAQQHQQLSSSSKTNNNKQHHPSSEEVTNAARHKESSNNSSKSTKQTSSSSPAQQQQHKQQQQQDAEVYSVDSIPPSRCFKRGVPDKNLEDAVHALFSIKEAPSNRPDLKNWIPDSDDASDLLHYLNMSLKELKNRPAVQKLITENHLTDDDIKILHSYKVQNPYPVYLWLNGWLGGDRRDDFVKEHVAPFFTLLYRAMEKLPRITTVADRAIKVNGIASLKHTFDNYKVACTPGNTLSFWGFSSFSTESDVVNREEFVGKPSEEAIVYSCGALEGVDMEPFAPKGLKDESEILPLCPCVLEVVNHVKMGQKLIVGVKQLNHADFSYVATK